MCLTGNLNQPVPRSTKHNCVEIFDISRAGHDNFGRWGSRTEGIPILRLVNLPHQFLELGTEDIWFVIGLGSRASSKYESFSDVGEIRVWWRANFQSGYRVLKKVF